MSFLLLAVLAADPLQSGGVFLHDEGGTGKVVRHLDCRGAGITCSSSTTFGVITVTGSDGGGGLSAPAACSAGQCVTSNGSSLSCTSTITASSVSGSNVSGAVATATALAANPSDCSAGQYANAIDSSGNLTCGQVATSQLSGTITNAQLASSYSGVGACGSHQWASTLNTNAAPTCTQPSFSDLSGSPLAGGSTPQVQYNNSGVLGGVSNFQSDGTRVKVLSEYGIPSAPAADYQLQFGHEFDGGWPMADQNIDSFWGAAIPRGWFRGGIFSPIAAAGGSGPSWFQACAVPAGWGSTTTYNLIGDTGNTPQQTVSSNNTVAFDGGASWRGRQRLIGLTATTSTNTTAAIRANAGQVSALGGFVWWGRTYFVVIDPLNKNRAFMGLANATAELSSSADPSAAVDTIYFGQDVGQSTLHICSNGASGTASCTDLGSNFPVQSGAGYDFWLAVPPGAAFAEYAIIRLDAAQATSGRIAFTFGTGIQVSTHMFINTGTSATGARQDWGGWCYWTSW